jgi:hypothetical protein
MIVELEEKFARETRKNFKNPNFITIQYSHWGFVDYKMSVSNIKTVGSMDRKLGWLEFSDTIALKECLNPGKSGCCGLAVTHNLEVSIAYQPRFVSFMERFTALNGIPTIEIMYKDGGFSGRVWDCNIFSEESFQVLLTF